MTKYASFSAKVILPHSHTLASQSQMLQGKSVCLMPSTVLRLAKSDALIFTFHIVDNKGYVVGDTSLIADPILDNVKYTGHIGGSYCDQIKNAKCIAEAATLLYPKARDNGLSQVLITCRQGDNLIEEACSILQARLLDTISVPPELSKKPVMIHRFLVDL